MTTMAKPYAASESVHVLVYGHLDSGITDTLRLGTFRAPLAALGVELRPWSGFPDDVVNGGDGGLTALEWADVVLFRRWTPTAIVCTECETRFESMPELDRHVTSAGHRTMVPDLALRPLIELLASRPELLRSKAIVYDTDDDILDYPVWSGFAAAAARERDLVICILGMADLVTCATPVLAERLAGLTRGAVRVVRNAVDSRQYAGFDAAAAAGNVRVLYHGVPIRLRDYEVARRAVDGLAARTPGLRRVWLGAANEPRVVAAVDEVLPWAEGLPAFAAALVGARPSIGLAPLLDEPFNRAKSELHWLEYSLAGAATVASGFDGPGPYDPIRDGVDGLIAHTPADWDRHLASLAASAGLRAEIAGKARERVLSEYSVAARAPEWADAFRWAAAHPAIGRASGSAMHLAAAAPAVPAPLEPVPAVPAAAVSVPASVRVLVVGPGASGASDALRFSSFIPALAGQGVELVTWTPGDPESDEDPFVALERAIGWSDVVVLRRSYRTWHACMGCGLRTLDAAEATGHATAAGHQTVLAPYSAVRPLISLLAEDPGAIGERAILYDTDDDIFSADLPPGAEDFLERDLVAQILGLADLVTCATPILADRLAGRTRAPVRVVRNALDPSWYVAGKVAPAGAESGVRIVYHGVRGRLRDYEVARPAVDSLAAELPGIRRVWLGAADPDIAAVVDEALPWVDGAQAFAAELAAARPDIGLAPLADTPYDRCRSELHWLEYGLAGAATVASGFDGPGPYDPIRDGVDGLIARTPADWVRHLRDLAGSSDLRAQISGFARERVLTDYTVDSRVQEWADAYRWAAEHAGAGRHGRAR